MTSPFSSAKAAASTSGGEGSSGATSSYNSNPQEIPSSFPRARRRSSFGPAGDYLGALISDVGGVNSLENFARSWTRAAGFHDLSRSPRSVVEEDEEGPDEIEQDDGMESGDADEIPSSFLTETAASRAVAHAASSDYGTMLNDSSIRHGGRLFRERLASGSSGFLENEPLLVKRVSVQEESGKTVHINVVVGQSTLPQTVFNSVNVLVGVGLLSLPLGIRYAGWVIGLTFFLFSTFVTHYTAKVLAKCLDTDKSLVTYADVAYAAHGSTARIVTSIVFLLELVLACVCMIVLFGDSLHDLIPSVSKTEWKLLAGCILAVLSNVPLRVLSFTSILGILACFSIIVIVFIDGLTKPDFPGSLRDPAPTNLFPKHWTTIPLSFGLLASSWGGHSVFPNIYRDMRHPYKFKKGLRITYTFTYLLDMGMAVIGYLMFGDGVKEEITSNIILTEGYSHALNVAMVVLIAIIPITKSPLSARPITSTCEILLGLDNRVIPDSEDHVGRSSLTRGLLRLLVRITCIALFVVISIIFPSFDRIMALLGSALCFTICVILPLLFYLKIFRGKLSRREVMLDWFLIIVSSICAVTGTIAAFIPKEKLGG